MKKKTLLIVEDDIDIYEYLQILLSEMDINILRAENGVKALELIDSGAKVDIILLDVVMPVMSGKEFFRKLRIERNSKIPVILSSVDEIIASRLESIGEVQGIFLKGGSGEKLKKLIGEILG